MLELVRTLDELELVWLLDELGLDNGDICVDVLDLTLLVLDEEEEIEEDEPVLVELLEDGLEDELATGEDATTGLLESDVLEDMLKRMEEIDVLTLLILLVTLLPRHSVIRTRLE
jgi:hypothetical protein